MIAQCRSFTLYYPFNNDVIRLTLACLDGGVQSTSQYTASNYQKFMKRELGNYDLAVTGAAFRKAHGPRPRIPSGKYVNIAARKGLNQSGPSKKISTANSDDESGSATTDDGGDDKARDSDDDSGDDDEETNGTGGRLTKAAKPSNTLMKNPNPDMATKLSPVLLAHYGQMNMCAKSYQGSICQCGTALVSLCKRVDVFPIWPRLPSASIRAAAAGSSALPGPCCRVLASGNATASRQPSFSRPGGLLCSSLLLLPSLIARRKSLAFLDQYRQLRTSENLADEVEYNFGRAFHQLSMFPPHFLCGCVLTLLSYRPDVVCREALRGSLEDREEAFAVFAHGMAMFL